MKTREIRSLSEHLRSLAAYGLFTVGLLSALLLSNPDQPETLMSSASLPGTPTPQEVIGILPVPTPPSFVEQPDDRIGNAVGENEKCGPWNVGDFPEEFKTTFTDPVISTLWIVNGSYTTDGGNYRELIGCNDWGERFAYLLQKVAEARADELAQLPRPLLFILDTGVDSTHEDLTGVIDEGLSANFVSNGTPVPEGTPGYIDDHTRSHGTHVTGIAAAVTNNGVGVVSLSNSEIGEPHVVALKVLDSRGSLAYGDLGRALQYILDLQNSANAEGKPIIVVVNMSFGTINKSFPEGTEFSESIGELFRQIKENGGILFAAAGNLTSSLDPEQQIWPAASDLVIGVNGGFIAWDGENQTVYPSMVKQGYRYSLGGGEVTWNGFSIPSTTSDNSYGSLTGTSQASPGVAGIVTQLLMVFPELPPEDILAALWSSGRSVEGTSTDSRFLNPLEALENLMREQGYAALLELNTPTPMPPPSSTPSPTPTATKTPDVIITLPAIYYGWLPFVSGEETNEQVPIVQPIGASN